MVPCITYSLRIKTSEKPSTFCASQLPWFKVIDRKFLYQDHLWNCPKVVLKTTFWQFRRWPFIGGTIAVKTVEKKIQILLLMIWKKVFIGYAVADRTELKYVQEACYILINYSLFYSPQEQYFKLMDNTKLNDNKWTTLSARFFSEFVRWKFICYFLYITIKWMHQIRNGLQLCRRIGPEVIKVFFHAQLSWELNLFCS